MIALALDPGATTGYCVAYLNENKLWVAPMERKFTLGELYDFLGWFKPYDAYVIYEDFTYRNASRMGLDLTPVKMIGVIELIGEQHGIGGLCKQTAAQGKGFFTDKRLKDMGVYKIGCNHGRDATRHLLQWFTFGEGSQFAHALIEYEMIEPGDIYEKIRA